MSELYLKFPSIEDKENVLDFKNEYSKSNFKFAGSGGLENIDTYEEWLERVQDDLNEIIIKEGRVRATQYLTYRKADDKLIGMIQIRHELNDALLISGGHIGDCIRPSEQGKGYATEQIRLALEKCRELKIKKVLMTCVKTNIASARTIQKNNGILENEIIDNGEIKQRYWIDISN